MLRTLRRLFDEAGATAAVPGFERRALQLAVAVLLHESTRVDLGTHEAEQAAAEQALIGLFGLDAAAASALLSETGGKTGHLTSYYAQVAVIKRDFSMEQRVALVEHLWRIAYAHEPLDPYEDHFVRKIAHLLYVPNTQVMLARSRARG